MRPNEVRALAELGRPLGWRAALSSTIGYVWRTLQEGEGVNLFGVDFGTRVLAGNHPGSMKLEAARLIQMSLGDLGGRGGTPGMFHGYTGTVAPDLAVPEVSRLITTLENVFPVGDRAVDAELGRTIAMLAPPSSRLAEGLLGQLTEQSHPVDDIHYLTCISRLDLTLSEKNTRQCAEALLAVEGKIRERQLPQDANWNDRLGELFGELVTHTPGLAHTLVESAQFGQPSHVAFLSKLEEEESERATEAFIRAVQSAEDYPWNNELVYVVGGAQSDQSRQLIRPLFARHDLRLAVLMVLAEAPQEEDRPLFVEGLDAAPPETLAACVGALERLSETETTPRECVALVKLLRRLGTDRSEFPLREKVARLLTRQARTDHEFIFGTAGHVPQSEAIQRWTEWAIATYPEESQDVLGTGGIDEQSLRQRLVAVDWNAGDVERGELLFRNRGCGQCHGNGKSLGPDLLGVTSRFSRDDLFLAIALPNRDVSPRYQTVLVETKSGKTYSGLVVYDSTDGILLRNGVAQTYRVDARDIANQRTLPNSLMPEGLLKDLEDRQLADLYAYLKSQSNRTASRDTKD
jgi:putative heme-binding domain-containing protein